MALPKTYTTLEAIAVESKIGNNDILFLSIYRPPKQKTTSSPKYMRRVEEELNDICQWACMQRAHVVVMGDLNMDRIYD